MADDWRSAREEVMDACRRIVAAGLVSGASGNVSRRLPGDLLAITPTRVPYDRLGLDDIVVIDFEGDPIDGKGVPSSETMLHVAVYRARPDVGGVIHTHSLWASALAVAGLEIPALLDEQVVSLGGPVRVAGYALPASEELGENAVAALEDRAAVLLRNHGALGVGATPAEAADVCELVERLARVFILARLLGSATPLPPESVAVERSIYRLSRTALKGLR